MLIRFLTTMVIVLVLTSGGLVAGPVVTATYETLNQEYLVRFTVHNTLQQEVISDFAVSVGDATDLLSPMGWIVSQDFRQVVWYAPDPSIRPQPGQSQNGFGFTMQNSPGILNWNVTTDSWSYNGYVSPVPVPEPSSILALAGGIAGLGGLALRRRRR